MMYFKPPQNNLTNPFYHPLNENLNEQKFTKARVMFKNASDARRDMRVAKETGLYQSATEKPSGRGRVYEITFKSEGQFRRFMSQFEVDLMEYPLKEGFKEPKKVNYKGGTALPSTMAKGRKPVVISTPRGYIVQTYDKKRDIFSQEGPAYKTKAEAEKAAKLLEDVQIDEAVKTKVEKTSQGFQVMVFSPKVKKFIPQGSPHKTKAEAEKDAKMFEDVQLDETNFRFPQPGEYYGDLGKSITDDPYYTMSKAELKKRSDEVDRKFAAVMRKHKRTKVGEVLDLLDKDGGTKLYKDSDIKQISKYLTKFKDNVRKVAHEMLIIVMEGDDYLAKKRIPVKEDVQLDESRKRIGIKTIKFAKILGLSKAAKEVFASAINTTQTDGVPGMDAPLATTDNLQKFNDGDYVGALVYLRKNLSKLPSGGRRYAKEILDALGDEITEMSEDVQLDEVTGETKVMAKGDQNQYERISRALTAAKKAGKIKGYEGAHYNYKTKVLTLIFDSKAHKPASERRKVAKMIKDFGLEFSHSVEEGFASDAQRRAAFASGYKAKGKKKKNEEEEVEEGLRQAMSGPKETSAQKQKRQEKDNFDLYKKRQARIAALRGDRSSRKLTKKQEKDYMMRVNLDQIKALDGKKKR